jgi:hypothetical protein
MMGTKPHKKKKPMKTVKSGMKKNSGSKKTHKGGY